jgi:hypothetical protein
MMTTSSNEESGDGRCQTIDNIVNNFISEHHDKSLGPLRLANISISEFSTELSNHLSVLNKGGSIAFGRGEDLTSKRLSLSLESLFSINTPPVREGPPLLFCLQVPSSRAQRTLRSGVLASSCQKSISNSYGLVGLGDFSSLGQIKMIAKRSFNQTTRYCRSLLMLGKR